MKDVRIVVKCPDCGETRVAPDEVTLRRCLDDETWSYRFTCPSCRRPTLASTQVAAALGAVAAGSRLEAWQLPAELFEPHAGPPLTAADERELRELLQTPDWFDVLARAGTGDR